MRYCVLSVLLLVVSLCGLYSDELGEMSEEELLTELMQILEQQEAKLTEQATQIQTLETHLTEARRQLTIAKVWQEALTARINKLQTLHTELKTSWQNYKDEKEREIKWLKAGLVGAGIFSASLGGLTLWQLTKK
jgi:septal ring factor EnvC (AmiA/AmiB activator)